VTMQELRGKVAVITGAASGMGRAFADRFAAEGMKVVLADVEGDALTRAVKELRAGGAEVSGLRTDVARLADVEALRDHALDAFGTVHVVCNNAGVSGGSILDSPMGIWQWVVGVNLWGVIHGCHVFLPLLLEQDEGHVVNTASLAGLGGAPSLGVYCTTKFAVVGLSESLYHDLGARGSNVGVSVLCPGFVQTRIHESHRNMPDDVRAAVPPDSDEEVEAQRAVIALGIPPEDAAAQVVHAVTAPRFYVLPHPRAARGAMESRLAWMDENVPAELDLEALFRP
jgi:NAD(P)-dependent dehydrogenase (short-subunit alcohol dehydrogenase family)